MAGLLDYLSYATNPIGNAGMGLLRSVGPSVLDFYKNQAAGADIGGSQYDPMGNFNGVQTQAVSPYPAGTDPVTAGGTPPQSQPFVAPQAAPLAQGSGQNPISVGNYQMPRVGNPDSFIPEQVNTPQNAQSTQGQIPQQPQALPPAFGRGAGSFLDGLNSGLQSIGNGGSIIGALTGNQTDPQAIAQRNLKAQYDALAPIVGPQKAMIALLNPKASESIFAEAFGTKEAPKNVEELLVRQAWDGRNKTGGPAPSMGDTIQKIQDWKTSEKAAEKRSTTMAEEQAKRAVALPSALARAEDSIKQIDELKAHPWKTWRTGAASIAPGIPGTGGADFDERVKQLKGGAFLEAYSNLRGTGAISEAEGIKAEQAQARLSQAKSPADFDQALKDLRDVLVRGYANAQKMAGEEKIKPYEMPVGESKLIGNVTIRRTK